ncbi:hypothetical protein [Paractinoplanes deccanensis]|uniref:hypothetical protein n=1 Tax=Paractinoplanes deccanensis TaxID=113561 RepID=UPI001943B5FE|nr:hypothetical protein [Actinoplanes deccanensis]
MTQQALASQALAGQASAEAPLDEVRRTPIDRIDHAVSATIVRRIVRREAERAEVTPFSSGI